MQPRGTSHYTSNRMKDAKISKESLAADLASFQRNGGTIEKIGNTPFRHITAPGNRAGVEGEEKK